MTSSAVPLILRTHSHFHGAFTKSNLKILFDFGRPMKLFIKHQNYFARFFFGLFLKSLWNVFRLSA